MLTGGSKFKFWARKCKRCACEITTRAAVIMVEVDAAVMKQLLESVKASQAQTRQLQQAFDEAKMSAAAGAPVVLPNRGPGRQGSTRLKKLEAKVGTLVRRLVVSKLRQYMRVYLSL